jgi:hypothetical protein
MLVAQAIPQSEMAKQLGVSSSTISLDMQYLRNRQDQHSNPHRRKNPNAI